MRFSSTHRRTPEGVARLRNRGLAGYMARDQRFRASRPDVVHYRGEVLTQDLTIAGPVSPTLFVATTGTDGDWVVKLIDEHPDGFQELVRGDVMRAKFRTSFTKPTPLVPGKVAQLVFTMPDVFHTFRRGHRMLVQVHRCSPIASCPRKESTAPSVASPSSFPMAANPSGVLSA